MSSIMSDIGVKTIMIVEMSCSHSISERDDDKAFETVPNQSSYSKG